MGIVLEVFRNEPPGRACLTLSRNVMEVVSANLDKDIEVRFLPLSSPEAEERGVEVAPCLVVNRRRVVEGVPGPEEIARLLEEALPVSLGLVLTRSPHEGDAVAAALRTALAALEGGDSVEVFLLGDGVWAAKKGVKGEAAELLEAMLKKGAELTASGEHLKACGLAPEDLLPGTRVAEDPYDTLVDLVMERWDKVMVV